jgi:FdhD protein
VAYFHDDHPGNEPSLLLLFLPSASPTSLMDGRRTGQSRVRMRAVEAGRVTARIDVLATEEPMEIRMRHGADVRPIAVTMRTPGDDFELAAGFLFAEGLIAAREEVGRIEYCLECEEAEQRYNIVTVAVRGIGPRAKGNEDEALGTGHWALESRAKGKGQRAKGVRAVTSACGLCGKERLDDIERRGIAPLEAGPVVGWETIVTLPEKLRATQGLFSATGGLHAAALFTAEGELLAVREDVGRHNAVDKVIGWAFLEAMLPLNTRILMVSGRSSFEIAQKALAAGIPILCAVSAPSSLAADLAQRFGMTLVGFLRGGRFNIYSAPTRIDTAHS